MDQTLYASQPFQHKCGMGIVGETDQTEIAKEQQPTKSIIKLAVI